MPYKTPAIVLGFAASAVLGAAAFAQEMQTPSMPADLARMAESAQTSMAQSARYLPEYTDSGEMKLPQLPALLLSPLRCSSNGGQGTPTIY